MSVSDGRTGIYYKILNYDLVHHKFQYKLGLNIDTNPFNPTGSCKPGGLYYTDFEHIHMFLEFGCYIAEVRIPSSAKVYKDPSGTKWKADKIRIMNYTLFENYKPFHNKEWLLKAVRHKGAYLTFLPEKLRSFMICQEAIKQNDLIISEPSSQMYWFIYRKYPELLNYKKKIQ